MEGEQRGNNKIHSEIKNFVLKSGIPLETSVQSKLLGAGFRDGGELEYKREDNNIHSIDIDASKYFSIAGTRIFLHLNLAIECKYKAANQKWVFAKFKVGEEEDSMKYDSRGSGSNMLCFNFFDFYLKEKQRSSNIKYPFSDLNSTTFGFRNMNKGTEVGAGDVEGKSIKDAVYQVAYGAANAYRECLEAVKEDR